MIKNFNKDIIDLNQVEAALKKKEKAIKNYFEIMNQFQNIKNDKEEAEFEKLFNRFYKLRRNIDFRKAYFNFLNINKNNSKNIKFENTLKYINDKTKRLEPSFSSKLVATINPTMPVWDSIVLNRLKLMAPSYRCEDRLEQIIILYNYIIKWYKRYLKTKNAKEAIKIFDKFFPNNSATNIKKIDLIIWSMGI